MHTQRQLICSNGCRQTCKQLIICYKEILSQHTFNITIILAIHKSVTKFCHPYPRPIELTNQQLTLKAIQMTSPCSKSSYLEIHHQERRGWEGMQKQEQSSASYDHQQRRESQVPEHLYSASQQSTKERWDLKHHVVIQSNSGTTKHHPVMNVRNFNG